VAGHPIYIFGTRATVTWRVCWPKQKQNPTLRADTFLLPLMKDHPLKTFIIYASKDRSLREELESHLRPFVDMGWLALWSDREILPGARWGKAIEAQLVQADLFLLLVSVDFYNSGYIREKEFTTAVARLESGDALVIPIIVRHCTWKFYPVIKDLHGRQLL